MKRLLTSLFQRIARSLGIPSIHERLDALEGAVFLERNNALIDYIERRMNDHFGAGAKHFDNELRAVRAEFVTRVEEHFDEMHAEVARIRQSVDTVRRSSTAGITRPVQAPSFSPMQAAPVDDAFYVALEDHFRGSRDVVAERQRNYLEHLPGVIDVAHPIVDLGCGRGEWVRVLTEQRIPALGIDSNEVCITECRELGLPVECDDLVSFLENRPDSSVGTYTLFQVLEHLPFPVLLDSLRHMKRTLVPGGIIIAEVPNAKNLRVSAGTFWIDPTHQRPLFPELLIFLAEEVGFTNARGLYVNDMSPKFDLTSLEVGPRIALERLLEAVDTAGDFALIATA